jgi:hypothetical protein
MKIFAVLAAVFATAYCHVVDTSRLSAPEKYSPQIPKKTPILWAALTNSPPKELWIYRRVGPQIFSAPVISNAMILASLQGRGFPKPSTNDFFISEDKGSNCPGSSRVIFSIQPRDAALRFCSPAQKNSEEQMPIDSTIVALARNYAAQLGVKLMELSSAEVTSQFNLDTSDKKLTNEICSRTVFLSRQLDGINFFSANHDGEGAEGFSMEFGSRGQIRSCSLVWPELVPHEKSQIASPQRIMDCFRAQKTLVLPEVGEERYFERVKLLATAKKFTIAKMTTYYGEGVFGETSQNNEPSKFITPFVEFEVIAEFENNEAIFRLVAPILITEVERLLKPK